jgi:hypothetical protein
MKEMNFSLIRGRGPVEANQKSWRALQRPCISTLAGQFPRSTQAPLDWPKIFFVSFAAATAGVIIMLFLM